MARKRSAPRRHVPLQTRRHARIDLSRARVLLTNDDGIHSPGIEGLEKVLSGLAREVWTVAPETEQSAAGHSLTLRRPLRIRALAERRFAVDGTPTDCVLLAAREIMRDKPIDLVISGINRGGNIADDVTYSGTIAAAMEAALLGLPAIAFSQVCDGPHPVKWATAEHWLPEVLKILRVRWPLNVLINVNFPDVVARSARAPSSRRAQCEGGSELMRGRRSGEPYWWTAAREDHSRRRLEPISTPSSKGDRGDAADRLFHGPTLKALRRVVR